jgi:hypothetical protein
MSDHDQPSTGDQADDLWLIDRILAGETGPEQAPLAELFSAAAAPAQPAELAGLDAAVAAFTELRPTMVRAQQARARKLPVLSALLANRVAAAAAVGGIALASTVPAAYAGALPAGLQNFAHHTIGAQAAHHQKPDQRDQTAHPTGNQTSSPTTTPISPDPTSSASFALCTAWTRGELATTSVAYTFLETAAGGKDNIAAYCATITHPGAPINRPSSTSPASPGSIRPTSSASTHPDGNSSSHPTSSHHPSNHPAGDSPTSAPPVHPSRSVAAGRTKGEPAK